MACCRFGLKRVVAYATRSIAVSPFRPTNPRAFASSSSSDFSPYMLGGIGKTRQTVSAPTQQNSFTKIDRLKMAAKESLMNSQDVNLLMWFAIYHQPATIQCASYLLGLAVLRFILLRTLDKVPTSPNAGLNSLLHHVYQHQKRYIWTTDKVGTHFVMNVNGHEKQDVSVFYCNYTLFITDKGLSPTRKTLKEVVEMPTCTFDPSKVTGDVTKGGILIISFPFGDKKEIKPLYFEVMLD